MLIMKNIVLRLDPSYNNIGDIAINEFAIRYFLSLAVNTKASFSIIAPHYKEFYNSPLMLLVKKLSSRFHTEIIISPDIIDIIESFPIKNKILGYFNFLLKALGYLLVQIFFFIMPARFSLRFKSSRLYLIRLASMLSKVDYFIICGGGYINEMWYKSSILMLYLLSIVKIRRSRIILGPSSIGPIYTPRIKIMLKFLLNRFDEIYVREDSSLMITREILGANCQKIKFQKDWGYKLLYEQGMRNSKPSLERSISVHIRPTISLDTTIYYNAIIELINRLSKQVYFQKIKIVIIEESELNYIKSFSDLLSKNFPHLEVEVIHVNSYRELIKALKDSLLFIGSSFHFILISCFLNKPAIAIALDDYHLYRIIGIKRMSPRPITILKKEELVNIVKNVRT